MRVGYRGSWELVDVLDCFAVVLSEIGSLSVKMKIGEEVLQI